MTCPVYYNEWEDYPAAWLENLIAAGHLPAGDVDRRDIREVAADDLKGYGQCHFFAGIGGWPFALELAGWQGHEWHGPVWTGSCPCQPLSSAGQRKGHADERHLWPAFHALIAERRPATVFGEQVASKLGREWLAGVRADLEDLGYALGAGDLCAAGVGAPHIRQRLFWVADAESAAAGPGNDLRQRQPDIGGNGAAGGLGHTDSQGPRARRPTTPGPRSGRSLEPDGGDSRLGDAEGYDQWQPGPSETGVGQQEPPGRSGISSRLADLRGAGLEGRKVEPTRQKRQATERGYGAGFWRDFDLIPCADGKARRVEPGTFPLAHGIPNRVGQLRAYGNAITPQQGAEFVTAFMECRP